MLDLINIYSSVITHVTTTIGTMIGTSVRSVSDRGDPPRGRVAASLTLAATAVFCCVSASAICIVIMLTPDPMATPVPTRPVRARMDMDTCNRLWRARHLGRAYWLSLVCRLMKMMNNERASVSVSPSFVSYRRVGIFPRHRDARRRARTLAVLRARRLVVVARDPDSPRAAPSRPVVVVVERESRRRARAPVK